MHDADFLGQQCIPYYAGAVQDDLLDNKDDPREHPTTQANAMLMPSFGEEALSRVNQLTL